MIFKHDISKDKQIRNYGGVFTYIFTVATSSPQRIHLKISDINKANTSYLDRYNTVNGERKFYVRMPQSPSVALIEITNDNNRYNSYDSFKLTKKKIIPLGTKFSAFDVKNPIIKEFIFFAQEFSENSGILSDGIYQSDGGNITLKYNEILKGEKGNAVSTPSRIGKDSGVIEVSRKKFNEFTVAGRMAILLHEFSHFYLNKVQESEVEADLNALLIYLGLGYPRIEAEKVFLRTFDGNPTDGNVTRYEKIKALIDNFDKADLKLL